MTGGAPFDERQVMSDIFSGEPGGAWEPPDELSMRRRLDHIVARSFENDITEDTHGSTRRTGRWIAMAAAAAVIALVIAVLFFENKPDIRPVISDIEGVTPDAISKDPNDPSSARFMTEKGQTSVHLISPGVQLFVKPESSVEARSTGHLVLVQLKRGEVWLSVDHRLLGADKAVTVRTGRGDVTVTGTVFGVNDTPGFTEVFVLEGTVRVTPVSTEVVQVETGYGVRIGDGAPFPIDPKTIRAMWRWLMDQGIPVQRIPANLHETSGALSMSHPAATDSDAEDSGVTEVPTAHALMKAARRHQNNGRYRSANATFNKLFTQFPSSEEAAVARLADAQLLLDKLDQPRQALNQFNIYLQSKRHTALRAEALYGKARAFKKLGNLKDACVTWQMFVKQYPGGILTKSALQQLNALQIEENGRKTCPK